MSTSHASKGQATGQCHKYTQKCHVLQLKQGRGNREPRPISTRPASTSSRVQGGKRQSQMLQADTRCVHKRHAINLPFGCNGKGSMRGLMGAAC
eukprot:4501614-Amphidinium_carterae.2